MDQDKPPSALAPNTRDYVAGAVKAIVGAVPFAGSLLVEIAGTIIPNQRIDRLAQFARELEEKLNSLDQGAVRAHLTDENFTDLIEEGLRSVAAALTLSPSINPSSMLLLRCARGDLPSALSGGIFG